MKTRDSSLRCLLILCSSGGCFACNRVLDRLAHGPAEKISAQLRGHKAVSCKGPARLLQRLQQESNVGNRSQEGSKDEIRQKIDENRPFADLEKLVFGF